MNKNENIEIWKPDMKKIETIMKLISLIESADNDKQRVATERFTELKQDDEFPAYCAAIFAKSDLSLNIRRHSGLLLKETLRHCLKSQDLMLSDRVFNVCKQCLIQCLCETTKESKFIRETSAIAISTIIRELHVINPYSQNEKIEFDEWPDLMITLLKKLKFHQNDSDPTAVESILHCIHLLCYDCGVMIGKCNEASTLVQALIQFALNVSVTSIVHKCLLSLYYLFHSQPNCILSNMESYKSLMISCIRSSTEEADTDIMCVVIDTMIVQMNEYWDSYYISHSELIFKFMLFGTGHANPDVAMRASEFWSLYAMDSGKNQDILVNFLPKLVGVLCRRCKYTNELLSDMDLLDEEDDGVDSEETAWNIRKCSASQLEKLANCKDSRISCSIYELTIPMIKQALSGDSNDLLTLEAGLLILGAITRSDYSSLIPSLPQLIPFIMSRISFLQKRGDSREGILVITIGYWSLARFGKWYVSSSGGLELFDSIFFLFLEGMKSHCSRICRASCGAISTFMMSCSAQIMSSDKYISALMQTFLHAFSEYSLGNFPQLIDVILCCTTQMHAHSASSILCHADFQRALIPPIVERWVSLQNNHSIFPLFEAITTWTSLIGHTAFFQKNYLQKIYEFTMRVAIDNSSGSENSDIYSIEYWVCSLDLLAVLVEKCNPKIAELIWNENSNKSAFLEMIYQSICCTQFNARRNGLALLGDLITMHSSEMREHICPFLTIVIANLNWDWQTVATNASWVIGQCLCKYSDLCKDFAKDIFLRLNAILECVSAPEYMKTNVAITMSRILECYPSKIQELSAQMDIVEWIKCLHKFAEQDNDKISAFHTAMNVVMQNPKAIVRNENGCKVLFESIAEWTDTPNDLHQKFSNVIHAFKNAAPNWDKIVQTCGQSTRTVLKNTYNV